MHSSNKRRNRFTYRFTNVVSTVEAIIGRPTIYTGMIQRMAGGRKANINLESSLNWPQAPKEACLESCLYRQRGAYNYSEDLTDSGLELNRPLTKMEKTRKQRVRELKECDQTINNLNAKEQEIDM
jgi:hypothetical protein